MFAIGSKFLAKHWVLSHVAAVCLLDKVYFPSSFNSEIKGNVVELSWQEDGR